MFDIFPIFAQNIDLCFRAEKKRKNNVYSFKPTFLLYKSGLKGGVIYMGVYILMRCGTSSTLCYIIHSDLTTSTYNQIFTIPLLDTSFSYKTVTAFSCLNRRTGKRRRLVIGISSCERLHTLKSFKNFQSFWDGIFQSKPDNNTFLP